MGLLSFDLLWAFLTLAHIMLDLLDPSSIADTSQGRVQRGGGQQTEETEERTEVLEKIADNTNMCCAFQTHNSYI